MSMMQRVEDWQVKAACRGPQGTAVFFPPSNFERKDEKEDRESRAKAICGGCLVRKPRGGPGPSPSPSPSASRSRSSPSTAWSWR